MNRRTTIPMFVAAVFALAALPALAAEQGDVNRPERQFPPAWVSQTVAELRTRVAEQVATVGERIAASPRLSEDQKAAALENLDEALEAVAAVDEPAEIVGTATSRRQLQRLEWRAARTGDSADLTAHVARDLDGAARRLEWMTTVATWADVAGEDVTEVAVYLDEASVLLGLADGDGSVVERHDAIHIARAWMTKAHVMVFAL